MVSFLPSFPSLVTLAFCPHPMPCFAGKSQKPESHLYPHGQSQRNVSALYSYHFMNEVPTYTSPLLLVFTTEGTAWFCITMLKQCLSNPNLLSQIQTHLFQFILKHHHLNTVSVGIQPEKQNQKESDIKKPITKNWLKDIPGAPSSD